MSKFLYGQTNTFPTSGNVGIGTMNPGANLSFKSVLDGSDASGITWYSPRSLAYGICKTAGIWDASLNYQQLQLSWETGIVLDPGSLYGKSYVDIQGAGLRVTSGNLGIGTVDTKGYKLAVNGKIRAHEIKVEIANLPDYVFAKDYKLPSLKEPTQHIQEKGHLPGEEIKANGINLGEINAKLLKKMEKLTLYMIELKKKNER
ncbi:hypothetical protein CPT03_16960 [Pedobacter ginsengisoli]|uniref:Peptidase S74 domain-containing protein n=2 Tax=Pedobacter ginsengisoli TaxID=363852 RepID=A0A2D1U8U2_9SPHI|nr:hypothetical protein CPT03_16960 [Pedobacter ginsengisoli]